MDHISKTKRNFDRNIQMNNKLSTVLLVTPYGDIVGAEGVTNYQNILPKSKKDDTLDTLFQNRVSPIEAHFISITRQDDTMTPCFFIYNNNNKKDIYIGDCSPLQGNFNTSRRFLANCSKQGVTVSPDQFLNFNQTIERKFA